MCRTHDLAWDCATGNGQAALSVANHFERVIATDASATQIRDALASDVIEYKVAPAEASGLPDASVSLITVAQALHWFDFDAFFFEATRVARDDAILAVWCYERCKISPDIDDIIENILDTVEEDWPPERDFVWNAYRQITMPWPEVDVPVFDMVAEWSAEQMLGYLDTWSASKRFAARTGRDPLGSNRPVLRDAWGEPQRTVRWPLTLRVCRRPPR